MAPPDDGERHLTAHRVFVVQFYSDIDISNRHVAGRAEHIVSGQNGNFFPETKSASATRLIYLG